MSDNIRCYVTWHRRRRRWCYEVLRPVYYEGLLSASLPAYPGNQIHPKVDESIFEQILTAAAQELNIPRQQVEFGEMRC